MNSQFKKVMIFSSLIFITANFHHPVNPTYFTMLDLPSHVFGTSFAVMVFASFLTSPLWGSWGDNKSRKMTLVYSTILYGTSQLLYGMANNIWQILIMRGIAGLFTGGFMVGLMAMVVDVSTEEKRGERIATYSALMSVSMAVGFLTGGALGYLPIRYVFFIQGAVMILIGIGIYIFMDESNKPLRKGSKPQFIWNILGDKEKREAVFTPWILSFLGITFFAFIAYSSNNNAFNYYLRDELNFEPIVNGIWKATTGIIGLVANLTINVWIVRKTELKTSLRVLLGLALMAATMIYLKDSTYPFMLWSLLYFTFHTILFPLLQNFAVEDSHHGAGFMSGIFNAIKALGEMSGAIIAGFAYGLGSKVPFLLSAAALLIALILGLIQLMPRNKDKRLARESKNI
ncbi:MFS transporter [Gudongella sp. DL1XJH-153]|uniref:MFS transporter n=1 Tax=Gudongella sp. DL1XJH-153 TaxID=3409804 RepID=UPI003BB52FA4